jgi:hypothetical protein
MKKIFNLFLMMAIATTISLTSCKTDGCTDPTASNYDEDADNDDGSCIINGCTDATATNFNIKATNDDGSCSYERDLFLGTYNNIIETCSGIDPSNPYSITISASSSNTVNVTISNFGNASVTVNGSVDGNSLTILPQTFTDLFGTFTLSGNATINASGSSLTMYYSYVQDGVPSSCSFTATN